MTALVIIDMQNDFMPGGALGVPGADELFPLINWLMPKFPLVLATQDWHPPDHVSFAENHPGKKPGDVVLVRGTPQILWPVHCVCHTSGAELVSGLNRELIKDVFFKGSDPEIDSYSAFFDNEQRKSTGLADYLHSQQVTHIFLVGVATDYCVLYSALDALSLGFAVTVIRDACRGIDLKEGDVDRSLALMQEKGAQIISSRSLCEIP